MFLLVAHNMYTDQQWKLFKRFMADSAHPTVQRIRQNVRSAERKNRGFITLNNKEAILPSDFSQHKRRSVRSDVSWDFLFNFWQASIFQDLAMFPSKPNWEHHSAGTTEKTWKAKEAASSGKAFSWTFQNKWFCQHEVSVASESSVSVRIIFLLSWSTSHFTMHKIENLRKASYQRHFGPDWNTPLRNQLRARFLLEQFQHFCLLSPWTWKLNETTNLTLRHCRMASIFVKGVLAWGYFSLFELSKSIEQWDEVVSFREIVWIDGDGLLWKSGRLFKSPVILFGVQLHLGNARLSHRLV